MSNLGFRAISLDRFYCAILQIVSAEQMIVFLFYLNLVIALGHSIRCSLRLNNASYALRETVSSSSRMFNVETKKKDITPCVFVARFLRIRLFFLHQQEIPIALVRNQRNLAAPYAVTNPFILNKQNTHIIVAKILYFFP